MFSTVLIFDDVPYIINDYIWANLNFQKSCNITLNLQPNQYGTFKTLQEMNILGSVADDIPHQDPTSTHLEAIHTMHISLSGISNAQSTKRQPKFNPGKDTAYFFYFLW